MLLKFSRYVAVALFGLGTAGLANAQTTSPLPGLTLTLNDIPSPGVQNDGNFSQAVLLAEETGNTPTSGNFEFRIDFAEQSSTTGTNPVNRTITVSATGQNASLANIVFLRVTPPPQGSTAPPTVQDVTTEFSSGYSIPPGAENAVSTISMRANLTFAGCNAQRTSGSVQVTVRVDEGNVDSSPLESMASVTAIECVNAYSISVVNDATAGGGNSSYQYGSVAYDTSIAGPPIDATASGTTTSFNDTPVMGTHGLITISFDPSRPDGTEPRNIYTTLNSGPLAPRSPTDAGYVSNPVQPGLFSGAPGEIQSLILSLRVPTEIASAGIGSPGYVKASTTPAANIAQISLPLSTVGTRTNPYRDGIVLTLQNNAAQSAILDSGAVALVGGSVTFAGLGPSTAEFATQVILLDDLNVDAVTCGQFDWVSDPSNLQWGGNVFWVTGHGPNVTEVMARFSNSADASKNTTVALGGLDLSGTPIQITETELNAANANFGVADVELIFIGANGATLDCDRLLKPRPTDLLFSYGNDRVTSGHGDD